MGLEGRSGIRLDRLGDPAQPELGIAAFVDVDLGELQIGGSEALNVAQTQEPNPCRIGVFPSMNRLPEVAGHGRELEAGRATPRIPPAAGASARILRSSPSARAGRLW